MSHWNEFDYVIVNDDLPRAVEELRAILLGDAPANRVGSKAVASAVDAVFAG